MRLLLLNGYACQNWIWDEFLVENECLHKVDKIEWPKDLLGQWYSLEQYIDWLTHKTEIPLCDYDMIIGHSMGGLIALKAANQMNIKQIILVETFLKSPVPFFQNLLYENANQELKLKIETMLKIEGGYYTESIKNEIKEIDMTHFLNHLNSEIYFIYGDRGTNDLNKVIDHLKMNQRLGLNNRVEEILNHVIQND